LTHNYANLSGGIMSATENLQPILNKGIFPMINSKLQALVCIFVLGLAIPISVLARDVANEQYMVTVAQKNYDNAQAELVNATLMLQKQEKVLAQEQLLLKKEQERQAAATLKVSKAKEELEKQQKALEKAWNKDSH
jgi:hypothetical protein